MNKNGLVLAVCALSCAVCVAGTQTPDVRHALDIYTNSVRRTLVRVETIRNVGVSNAQGEPYQNLCRAVSNDIAGTFLHLHEITTNAAERLVLMSTAWQWDENSYLDAYDVLAGLAISNRVSKSELEWFGMPDRNDLSNCIRCRYRETRVTNLVYKIARVTGDTNQCRAVVSGESYTNYLEEVSAGLW